MPILNYTTSVSAITTVGQIIGILSQKKAQSVTQRFYEDGRCRAISFVMMVSQNPIVFELPANVEGVLGILQQEEPFNSYRRCTRDVYQRKQKEQAEKIAWRILKDWIEAQMALIESGQAEPAQVFLPYAVQADGKTMWQIFNEYNQLQLVAATTA